MLAFNVWGFIAGAGKKQAFTDQRLCDKRQAFLSPLLWPELFVNHNQELFSQIQEEQREISDYVDDKFVPEFLHAMIAAGD